MNDFVSIFALVTLVPISIHGKPAHGCPYWQRGVDGDLVEWFAANGPVIRHAIEIYEKHGPVEGARLLAQEKS